MLSSFQRLIRSLTLSRNLQSPRRFHSTSSQMRSVAEQIKILEGFSACDVCLRFLLLLYILILCQVSDALLKLQKTPPGKVARAGYLADIGSLSLSIRSDAC